MWNGNRQYLAKMYHGKYESVYRFIQEPFDINMYINAKLYNKRELFGIILDQRYCRISSILGRRIDEIFEIKNKIIIIQIYENTTLLC